MSAICGMRGMRNMCGTLCTQDIPTMHPTEAPTDNFRRLIRQAAALCAVVHSMYIALFAWAQVDVLALFNVLSVATHCLAFWLARPGGAPRAASLLLITEITVHAIAATVLIGWGSGFHYLMLPVIPIAMLSSSEHTTTKNTIALCLSAFYLGLDGWSDNNPPLHALSHTLIDLLRYQNIITLLLSFIILSRGYYNVVTQAQAALSWQASTDPLTGAINRRRFMEVGRAELARQQRHNQPIALLLCDIDHFKRINDACSHKGGDQVLQDFHRRALGVTRSTDSICRWGGEEFLILLPETDMEGAAQLAERLRHTISATPFKLSGAQALPVTVTVGVTTLNPEESLLDAVDRADQALYRGKRQGRDQVVCSSSGSSAAPSDPAPGPAKGRD
jgi:diguanylate cyclase (GGDEF)-like protein